MDRLSFISILAAGVCLAACTKDYVSGETVSPDDICVAVENPNTSTKTLLSGEKSVVFESEDRIRVYDTNGNKAVYKYRAKIEGKVYFQKESGDDGFDIANFESAFYPEESVISYDTLTYVAKFNGAQTCTVDSFQSGSAPMISFSRDADGLITFSNCFAVIKFGFKYSSETKTPLTLDSLKLSSASHYLRGQFKFSSSRVSYLKSGAKNMSLSGCSVVGALDTAAKYYYVVVPGLPSNVNTSVITVKAIPTTDVPFSGKFTAKKTSDNTLVANNILRMNPFVLKPIENGVSTTYKLEDWNSAGNISVGQITLASSEVSVKVGETKDIQIFGVSEPDKITTDKLSGTDKYNISFKDAAPKYYVTIEGVAAGNGQAFVNDQVTNSGSYLNISVK